MSTLVKTLLTGLKASTTQLVGIIVGAWHILGNTGQAYFILTTKVTTILGQIIREYEKGPYMSSIVAFYIRELMRIYSITP
ncbi:hypothetical protein CY34DRAFT_16492 [Suillus luteus UH-Slu-Lm8-n1]|uniref:Unplaced genomic scaffold CY34scaffold_412, whole genome shotgun sequence n=1 Tax=Suillus luteus UH-Slu-Lm8-n1 TaxID=930992 RepID=A0A0D0APK0_9AGAM|nr:hypothetical protein CY34DRAFT_16492 [Suillus luteus UH-Slu-Lm8-n1]